VRTVRPAIRGGYDPLPYDYFLAAKDVYTSAGSMFDGFHLIARSDTAEAWVRQQDRDILVAFRGTYGTIDISADLNIVSGFNFRKNPRYLKDKEFFKHIRLLYPPTEGWRYYVTGHSLGGAIATAILEDFDDVIHAREYNPALFVDDMPSPKIDRIYNAKDPIYLYNGGRRFATSVVTNDDSLINYFTPYNAHSLDALEEHEKEQWTTLKK